MDQESEIVLENSSAGRADVCAVDSPLHDSALVIKPILVEEPNTLSQALRKRSTHLSLVLISAAALTGVAGCGNLEKDGANSRDVYANMEACKADWGTPGDCEEIEPGRSATGSRSFYGPRYYSRSGASGYTSTPRPGSRSSGSVSSSPSRGGFGASSARHSGSSSHSSGG